MHAHNTLFFYVQIHGFQIMYREPSFVLYCIPLIKITVRNRLAPAAFRNLAMPCQFLDGQKENLSREMELHQQKAYAALPAEILHKFDLMGVDVPYRQVFVPRFLSVEAYGQALHRSDEIDRTLFFEVGRSDGMLLIIHLNGGYGRGHLLDYRKAPLPVKPVCEVYQLLERAAPEAPGVPSQL